MQARETRNLACMSARISTGLLKTRRYFKIQGDDVFFMYTVRVLHSINFMAVATE